MTHTNQRNTTERVRPGSNEAHALAMLLEWTGGTADFGWHIHEWGDIGLNGGHLTLDQFLSALGRLRRKGLVECVEWHPGQGGGAPREWLWFPVMRDDT